MARTENFDTDDHTGGPVDGSVNVPAGWEQPQERVSPTGSARETNSRELSKEPGRSEHIVFTRESFPTPGMALRFNDDSKQDRVRAFAGEQARAATTIAEFLDQGLVDAETLAERRQVFDEAYEQACGWRHHLALKPDADGGVAGRSAEKFRMPISDKFPPGPNLDRLGHIGRFHDGAKWNDETRRYVGGEPTPASRIAEEMGDFALERFHREAADDDVLQNMVSITLPDGVRASVQGNRLLRGEAAQQAAFELIRRQEAKGLPTRGFDIGGDLIYSETASVDSREKLYAAGLDALAALENRKGSELLSTEDVAMQDAFTNAAYLFYQSPKYKRGSDAVHRTFLAAVYGNLFGAPPRLPHNIDLQAYVHSQQEFVKQMRTDLYPLR